MADRKATNKYYPPDWDPSKGSINTYGGQHPLRDRARKLDQGILIVRFELPYNIWCNGCNNPIGMGVRYNAEKKKIGNYYSTAILSFRMKCHLCDNWFEIHTNPKNATYDIAGGARKKVEDFTAEDNETIAIDTPEEFERRANDKFSRLEHVEQDAIKAKSGATVLTRLQWLNDRQWSDPYALSQKLRKEFRADKKARAKEAAECKAVADRVGFAFSILPESESDRVGSKRIEFDDAEKAKMERKLMDIKTGGLFSGVGRIRNGRSYGTLVKSSRSTTDSKDLSTNAIVAQNLASTVRANTRLQLDPFLTGSTSKSSPVTSQKLSLPASRQAPPAKAPLVDYGNDDTDSD
ncbi:hypothetical protein CPC16_008187 [Podila verticillata]|nr:hypothetical protein CPC16_008187 [Podila verticillata]KAI9237356.1 MAG: CWC16 protein [Podila humilis]